MMLSDEAIEGYAKQYEFYRDRIEKEGGQVNVTFYEYIMLKEKFKDYIPRGDLWWIE